MTKTVRSILLGAALMGALAACVATPGRVSVVNPVLALNLADGAALRGYDAVAYFTDSQPVSGSDANIYVWEGARWKFATPDHLMAFAAEPERYAPQYGGYCAFAVSRGTTADGDPFQWAIVDGKLFVNNNAFAMHLWNEDRPGNVAAGDINWPLIPKQPLPP